MDLSSPEVLALHPSQTARFDAFGMTAHGDAYRLRTTSSDQVAAILAFAQESGRPVVLRGSGRSYGDASLLPEAIGLDVSAMNQVLAWDQETGIIEVGAGATIETLWRTGLPDGWWPPVVSGTMFPTLAGALAMNIHGKNAYRVGPIGEHVLSFEVVFSNGTVQTVLPGDPLFPVVISSAGLLGVITRVRLQLKKVPSGELLVGAVSCANWADQFAAFDQFCDPSDYAVSWVDMFTPGRGLFHYAHYVDADPATLRLDAQDLPSKIMGVVPKSEVWRVLRLLNHRQGMRTLNAAKGTAARWLEHGKTHRQSLVAFSFLLDYVPNWRRAYSPGGFIQYQSFVPRERALEVFAEQQRMAQASRMEPFLGVLKRHRPDRFLMSHGVDGYSLALDFKVADEKMWPSLRRLAHEMNELVLSAGGKFYLAKDSTLRPEDAERSFPMAELRRWKAELDPTRVLDSALARRIGV